MSAAAKRPSGLSMLVYAALIGFGVWRLAGRAELGTGGVVWAWLLIVGGAVGLLRGVFLRIVPATTPEESARLLLDQQKTLYGGAHEYRRVTPRDFDGLDLDFYERTRMKLETLGFQYLGDVEDVTAASESNFVKAKAVLRVLVGEGGHTVAAVYDIRLFGFPRLLQFVNLLPRNLRTIDFESELTSGRHVCTGNTLEADTTAPFPGISKRRFPVDTPAEQLLEHHRRHLQDALTAEADVRPLYFAKLEDVLEGQNRQEVIKSAHKARIGYLNETELKSVLGKDLDAIDRQVLAEVRRLQRKEGTPPGAGAA